MSIEFANGKEDDGIKYRVYFEKGIYTAEVIHLNGQTITKTWECTYNPVCGMDVSDAEKLEEVLEDIISYMRSNFK